MASIQTAQSIKKNLSKNYFENLVVWEGEAAETHSTVFRQVLTLVRAEESHPAAVTGGPCGRADIVEFRQ